MRVEEIFKEAVKRGASDVHLAAEHPPLFRVDGSLVHAKVPALSSKQVDALIKELVNEARWKRFVGSHEEDFAYQMGDWRFRINLHVERGAPALSARLISTAIPSFDDLQLPPVVRELADLPNGLVIITGPAGTGKSTTLASLLQDINTRTPAHIVTLEDPIEHVFPVEMGLVKQREVGTDTVSFAEGLRRCLRQDPDVVMVGEMRDPDTIASTLTLAETGHLVFSTLHTSSAAQAIHRIVDSFSGSQQEQIRQQLSLSLRCVVAQLLFAKAGGGLIAAREVLVNTPAVANLIRENKMEQIASVIQLGKEEGMMTMERAVQDLLRDKQIVEEQAAPYLSGKRRR